MQNLFTLSPERKRGFTLLLAALVAAIVLALGSSIFSIARKQVTLSSLGRDSQFAFYAADTIIECALYYDVRFQTFPTSTAAAASGTITCDGVVMTWTRTSATANSAVTTFTDTIFSLDENGSAQAGNCASVTVYKNATAPYTVLHADGYSTPCATIQTSARALQRSIEIQY